MAKVRFRCDGKNSKMFMLNLCKELDYIPSVGDIIETSTKDFMKASFRIKPYCKSKQCKTLRNVSMLDFIVKSRKYNHSLNEWELICEPDSKSLVFLLREIKV